MDINFSMQLTTVMMGLPRGTVRLVVLWCKKPSCR